MKINYIDLKNFRNHRDTHLELGSINLIGGLNGAGKSSLVYAIEMALAGRCETTDRAGKGADDLIRVGEKKAEIYLKGELNGLPLNTFRSVPSGLQVEFDGHQYEGGIRDQQAALYHLLGTDERVIHAALNCREVTTMSASDIKTLTFDLLGISLEDLHVLVGAWLESKGIGPEEHMNVIDIFNRLYDPEESIEAAYKAAFERRKDAKKELARLETEHAAVQLPEGVNPGSLAEGEELLSKLRGEKEELVARRAAAEQAQKELHSLCEQVDAVCGELAELDALAIKAPEGDGKDPRLPAWRKKMHVLMEEGEKLRQLSSELAGELRGLEAAQTAFKKAGDCPLAPGLVPCSMEAEARKKLQTDLKKQYQVKAKTHTEVQEQISRCIGEQNDLQGQIDESETAEKAHEDLVARAGQQDALYETLERRLHDLEARKSELLAESSAPEDINHELQIIEARILKGEMIVRDLRSAATAAENKAKLAGARDDAANQVAALELLVEALGPQGIRADLLGAKTSGLQERINQSLEALTEGEYSVSLEMEPDFHVLVSRAGLTTELKQLSTSERIRVGLAITEALVNLSGLGVLVLDDAEVLDLPNRARLMNYLVSLQDDYETIIVLSTTERERLRPVPPVRAFWIEAGQVTEVALEEAIA